MLEDLFGLLFLRYEDINWDKLTNDHYLEKEEDHINTKNSENGLPDPILPTNTRCWDSESDAGQYSSDNTDDAGNYKCLKDEVGFLCAPGILKDHLHAIKECIQKIPQTEPSDERLQR